MHHIKASEKMIILMDIAGILISFLLLYLFNNFYKYIIIIIIILLSFYLFFYVPLFYKNYKIYIFGNYINLDKGIFIISNQKIKLDNINSFKIYTNIFLKFFGIYSLILYTKGAKLKINFLSYKDIKMLSDYLME